MPTLVIAILLTAILSFFSAAIQRRLRETLHRRPALLFALPVLFTAVFAAAAAPAGAWSLPLGSMVLGYTALPVILVAWAGRGSAAKPVVLDFAAVLSLWLPVEFAAGGRLVPLKSQGFLHNVVYAIAILLGLVLFRCFRDLPGMKYDLPRGLRDFRLAAAAFAILAPVLIVVGISIGFIPWPHLPVRTAGVMAYSAPLIFFATALPEEILFRSLIQNLLMSRFGPGWRTLLVASVIFGAAHLDNGPQPLPNWRYMIVATIAGVAYGRVFQKASSLMGSVTLHTMVDWTKHFFF